MLVVKIFFGNRSGVLLLLPLLIVIYVACNWFLGHHLPEPSGFGFWGELLNEDKLLGRIAAPVLILLNAILLNNIFNRNGFMEKNNYVSSLLYVVCKSFFHSFYFLSGFGIAETLLILALFQLYKLDQNTDGRRAVFNASFLIGLGATFYPIMITCIPFLFSMIWVLRPFIFRESALAVIGFALPLVYGGYYGSLYGIKLNGESFTSSSHEMVLPDLFVVGGGILLLTFAGMVPWLKKLGQSSIRLKKLFRLNLLLSLYIVLLATLEFFAYGKIEAISLLIGILILFLPYAFGDGKLRSVPSVVFYLVFFFSVSKFFISFDF
ncbi:MAG: hypothetical protein ACI837_003027 [Crocinitomicaceae bacterium]